MTGLRAITFDVDGTLSPSNSWAALTEALGASAEHIISIYGDYAEGRIDTSSAKQQVLDLWCRTNSPTRNELLSIFQSLPMRSEAHELIDWLKRNGYEICIISGSMDMYVSTVAGKLGVSSYFADATLIFDQDNVLVDLDYTLDQSGKKVEQLHEFCTKNSIAPDEVMVVGNGSNDLDLFDFTGCGVLLEETYSESFRKRSWRVIHRLDEVKEILTLGDGRNPTGRGKSLKNNLLTESLEFCWPPR